MLNTQSFNGSITSSAMAGIVHDEMEVSEGLVFCAKNDRLYGVVTEVDF